MKISIIIFIILTFVQACAMFEKDEKLLSRHEMVNGEVIEILYVGLGATTNDVMQVRKLKSDTLLWVSDKYNYLKGAELIGDTSLRLIVSDTGYSHNNITTDTIFISIK